MLDNILKDQWQTIEIDRIRSITQETEFSQMAELFYVTAQHKRKQNTSDNKTIMVLLSFLFNK